jgi:hypothetical protein
VLGFEGFPRLAIRAEQYEDELRMRRWLRRSEALNNLREQLFGVLDRLDEVEEMPA